MLVIKSSVLSNEMFHKESVLKFCFKLPDYLFIDTLLPLDLKISRSK